MKARNIISFGLLTLFFACTSESKTNLEVKGTIKNLEKIAQTFPGVGTTDAVTVFLYEIPVGRDQSPILLDSTTVNAKDPNFVLKGITNNIGMYDISINQIDRGGPVVPLINDATKMEVTLDLSKKDKYYTVNGSKASNDLQDFIYSYVEYAQRIDRAMNSVDSLKKTSATDSLIIAATNNKNQSIEGLNNYLKKFISSSNQSIVASFALGRASRTFQTGEFEAQLNLLVSKFPGDPFIGDIKTQYDAQARQSAELEKMQNNSGGNWVGKKAPDLVMPDANGKQVSISSFKGKFVLVDFWASWCGPCRQENPNLVAAYQEFKNKNFTILGVSLDKDKASWLEAVESDGLTWTHMSDLAYWKSSSVEIYQFGGIPFNVLIDPQGMVIAQSLRGSALPAKLREVLK